MENGYARIRITQKSVQLRFEQIDSPYKQGSFDLLRDKLYHEIPDTRWDNQIRWMVMPYKRLSKVLDFCYRELGVGCVKIENDHTDGKTSQLPLRF